MTQPIRERTPILTTVLLGALSAAGVGSAQAADTASDTAAPAAHWEQRKIDFSYQGFTAHYTCDGLRDNVRDILIALGARKRDMEIQSTGCVHLTGVEPFPGVRGTFWVLVPGTADNADQAGKVQTTHWQTVDLVRVNNLVGDQGQCELLEQLKRQVLPLFTSRNLNFHSTCVPHQIQLGDIQFTVDVLRPVQSATPPA
jgi:hypothetical protein